MVKAKTQNDKGAQLLLEKALKPAILQKLKSLLNCYNIDTIVMPLLSSQRIMTASWHTSQLFYSSISYLNSITGAQKPIKILTPWFLLPSTPQFIKKRSERILSMEPSIFRSIFWTCTEEGCRTKLAHAGDRVILFLDDVLTTGATLRFVVNKYEKKFPKEECSKIAFTCFRALSD